MKTKNSAEKRKFTRYRAREGAVAALRSSGGRVGQIVDISMGGLAFSYIHLGEDQNNGCELDIFVKENGFHLRNIPCTTVSDFDMKNELSFSSLVLRRRGIQFGDLNPLQKSELEYFIGRHTTGPA